LWLFQPDYGTTTKDSKKNCKNPNILGVSASVSAPVDFQWETTLSFNHQGITDSLKVARFWVDEDFAKTYQLKLIKGQFLQMDNGTYWKEKEKEWKGKQDGKENKVSIPIVINETAEKQFGFTDPIGQRIGSNVIVGVVKDFNIRTLYHQIIPVILENNPETIGTMSVKISPANRAATLKFIRDVYGKYRDQRNLSYSFFDDLMNEKYKDETILKNVTIAFSILAIVISVLGILGMAVFSISLRIKEIGIRKINGAKVSEVISMLNCDFVKWVAIAFVIATPIAYFAMNKWLENFAYKTTLSWWIFALAGLLALGIALLTVSWQSWKAATRNPVEALRYE
jgi:putative ABC transport system permease protein